MMADFFEDPDGINDSFGDGDAMWTALMSPTGAVEAPPGPDAVVLTTLIFEVVGPSAGSDLHYVDYLGDWGNTNVILSGGLHVTGDLSAGATVVVGGAACPADISGDGHVGTEDLLALLAGWGDGGGPADLDGDGTVGTGDLLILLSEWGACA